MLKLSKGMIAGAVGIVSVLVLAIVVIVTTGGTPNPAPAGDGGSSSPVVTPSQSPSLTPSASDSVTAETPSDTTAAGQTTTGGAATTTANNNNNPTTANTSRPNTTTAPPGTSTAPPAPQTTAGTTASTSSSSTTAPASSTTSTTTATMSTTTTTTTTTTAAPTLHVTLSIDCLTAAGTKGCPANGWILNGATVEFTAGETVFDVLKRETRSRGIHMASRYTPAYNSAYIECISNICEFDGGRESGWMYSVNGWYPNYGASRYELQNGDVIKWRYTCSLGKDIGGGNALG